MEFKRKIKELDAYMERSNRVYDKILEECFKLMKMKEEKFQIIIENQVKDFIKTAKLYFKEYL